MLNRHLNRYILRGALLFAFAGAVAAPGAARPLSVEDPPATEAAEKAARKKGKEQTKEQASEPATLQTKRRDPFVVPSRVKREAKVEIKKTPQPVTPPGVEARLTDYRNLVRSTQTTGQGAPDKLSPYLIDELTVTGIYRTSAGYGAFIVAGPTKLTFFGRPGMRTFDGLIKEITPTGVKFVRNTRFDDGSVRQAEEFRALRSGK